MTGRNVNLPVWKMKAPPPLYPRGDRSLEITEILTRLRMAEQAIDALQGDMRQAREKIRVLVRPIRFEDERK